MEEELTKGEEKPEKKAALALSRTKEEKNPCLSALYLLPHLFQQQRQCSPLSAAAAPAARWRRWPARREGERYGDYFFPNVSQSDRRWVLFSHQSRAFCAFCLALLASFSAAICRYDEASGLSAAREDQARDKRGAFARRWNRDEGKRKRRRRPSRKKRCFPLNGSPSFCSCADSLSLFVPRACGLRCLCSTAPAAQLTILCSQAHFLLPNKKMFRRRRRSPLPLRRPPPRRLPLPPLCCCSLPAALPPTPTTSSTPTASPPTTTSRPPSTSPRRTTKRRPRSCLTTPKTTRSRRRSRCWTWRSSRTGGGCRSRR